jgi:imidazoleglycerol-phosphate dehydratase
VFDAQFTTARVGQLSTDLVAHMLESFAIHARINLHARVLYGHNDHHKVEALFKGLARAMDKACRFDPRRHGMAPSTKGTVTA